ncbi:uncharacterized protein DS421_5g161610 [Arachis hypogaea]|nr:uncharacterized protein DS421_5g161610 [Arachis hypogaea]
MKMHRLNRIVMMIAMMRSLFHLMLRLIVQMMFIFIDSEEEYDDDSGFEELRGTTDGDRVDKGKGVVNGDFSDEEGFNSDEVDLDYEVGGGSDKEDSQDDDNDEVTRYPIHKDVKDMTSYKWEVGAVCASREEFKDTVIAYAVQTRRGLDERIIYTLFGIIFK